MFRRFVMCVAIVATALTFSPVTVVHAAQQAPAGQDEFVQVENLPATEQLPAAPLLIAAYAFVWIAAMGYVWSVWNRLGKVEREMHELAHRRSSRSGSR